MIIERLLEPLFHRFVHRGSLTVTTAGGRVIRVGDGGTPRVRARFTDGRAEQEILLDPELKLGELYMDGRLVLDEGSIYDLLQLLLQDSAGERSLLPNRGLVRIRKALRRVTTQNSLLKARRNVAHHYDLGNRLYDLFLDDDRQYSCAYFEHPGAPLEEAQLAKKRHVTAKLLVEPGHSVLDIGCGWGGLGLYLAEAAGAGSVKGITLSEEQLAVANTRARDRRLDGVEFALEDYRHTEGRFDRIVSVGMFEHVGPPHYDTFFGTVARLLDERGVMLLHTIGITGEPGYTNPWMTKYIFPGGHLPSLSEVMPAIERAGLVLNDVEVLRLHYAETLRHWRTRFLANWDEAAALYDERFCRMWECYLAMSEAAFRFEDLVVFQLQLTHRNDVVPITRDYLADREAALRRAEVRGYHAANDAATAHPGRRAVRGGSRPGGGRRPPR